MDENKEPRPILDRLVAPDRVAQAKRREVIRNYSYFGLIGLISIIAMFFVPFIAGGISGDFSLYFPKSVMGWIVYWIIRGGMAVMNIAIFALFKLQAKVNVRQDKNYIEAKTLLNKNYAKNVGKPRSPAQMEAKEWTTKGVTLVISSLLAGCTISALALSFDIMTFLSCISTAVIGICFGYVTMRKNEVYWTEEYLEYAKMKDKENMPKEEMNGNNN